MMTPKPYKKLLKFAIVTSSNKYNSKNNNTFSLTIEQSFTIFGEGAGQSGRVINPVYINFGFDDLESYPLGQINIMTFNGTFCA